MKKNRNCGGSMYPSYSQSMPIMGVPAPIMAPQPFTQPQTLVQSQPYTPSYSNTTYTQTYNNVEQQINNMQQQINSLENRVSKLESKSTTTYNNKYSDSNYYML